MQNKPRELIHLHRVALAILAAILVVGMASLASAQQTAPPSTQGPHPVRDNDITRRELQNFDVFLDNHPNIAKELQANPNLINDPHYVSQHRELQEFLNNHPGVKEELKENPGQFLNRERRFERSGKDITRGELRNFDEFLDKHPEVDKELQKNPNLVNDPQYLAQHPELKEFLEKHPGVRGELKEHPKFFMHRERRFERHERGEHRRRRP